MATEEEVPVEFSDVVGAMNIEVPATAPEPPVHERRWYAGEGQPTLHKIAENADLSPETMEEHDFEHDAGAVRFIESLGDPDETSINTLKNMCKNPTIETDIEGVLAGLLGSDWMNVNSETAAKLKLATGKFEYYTGLVAKYAKRSGRSARTARNKY